jgi:hypothetical protein
MKNLIKIVTLGLIISTISGKSFSGSSCSYDFFGNYNCNSSGNTGDWSSNSRTDFFGNDNHSIYDRNTNQTYNYSCRTDFFGNYVCN